MKSVWEKKPGKGGGSWKDRGFRFRGGVKETEVSGNKEVGDPGVKLPGVQSHRAGAVEERMAQLV